MLAALPRAECERLLPNLEPVMLGLGDVLHEPGAPVRFVYFPIDCTVCLLTKTESQRAVATGMVGYEGIVGTSLVFGVDVSPVRALVIAGGKARVDFCLQSRKDRAGHESRAQTYGLAALNGLRYGENLDGYFWVNDYRPVMRLEPYRPDLDNTDVSGITDSRGNYIFQDIVNLAQSEGEGFYTYYWQYKDEEGHIVPKLSYVKTFEPWGWVVGTGIYTEDVVQAMNTQRTYVLLAYGGVALVGLMMFWVLTKLVIGRPISWTQQALADAVLATTGKSVSRSTVQRVLSADGLRPHKVRAWLHSPDEQFVQKVERICSLYVEPIPDDTVVLCVDEKPMQVLGRRFPSTAAPDGSVRQDYESVRRGVRHLLGALNIGTGRVHGRVVLKRGADALRSFVAELGRIYRGKKVVIIWDNLNIHHDGRDERWTRFNAERGGRFEFVYTPLHASWVNQIEQWFSFLQRRILRYATFRHAG